MTPLELLSNFDFGGGDMRANLLAARLLLHYLADSVYIAEINSGQRVASADVMTAKIWLHELSEAARELSMRMTRVR